jgi:ABC-type transport system involved in multi-copper enzyme maturation permease subunit
MKKFFRKIESYMLKLKIRFHRKSRRLGHVKRTDMWRLLSGEFFKFVKGGTFKVSVVVLIFSMILTVSLYSADGTVIDLMRDFLGGENETDVFAMLDGINEDILSVAGEFGVDIPTETMSLMDEFFGDDKKVEYLSTSPAEYYKALNPARFFEEDLKEVFSEEMTEFILENRNFLKLILTTDTLMKAAQDFAAGNGSPLVNDILKLIEDNSYIIGVVASSVNLFNILQDTPAVTNINSAFEGLKDPSVKEEYRLEDFYAEFFGGLLVYEGEASLVNMSTVIKECFENTRLHTVHNVGISEFLTAAAPKPFDLIVFYRDVYESGIIGALFNPDKDFTFIDFLLNLIVLSVSPYELKDSEIPDGYEDMTEEEKDDVLKNAKFEFVKAYIFGFLGENYPTFNTYIKTLPLFDSKTLGKLVPEDYLRTEILTKAPYIVDVYGRMIETLIADSADNYKALTDFALYFAVLGDVHDMLYGAYYDNMVGLRSNVVRLKRLLDYFYNDGEYGKSSLDFIGEEVVNLGYMFDELLDLLADDSLSPSDRLEALDEKLLEFTVAYQDLAWFVWAGNGSVSLGLYTGESATRIPEYYDTFERQYSSFIRSMASVMGVVANPSKSTAVKLENINRLITGMHNNGNGFFFDIKKSDRPVEESLTRFFDAFSELKTAAIDEEFFEENYAFIYGEIKEAFTAYFTVFKDKEFILLDGINKLFSGEDAELMESLYARTNEFSYEEFRDASRDFSRLATIIIDYVPKVYMIEVLRNEKLNDEALSNMYGMMSVSVSGITVGITKYSTKSDIQKDLFYFENMDMYGKLASPGSLDNGYGFMNFGANFAYLFIIVIIIIIASGSIAGEYETGSIKLLLIRPYRRWKFLTAKILYVAICLAVMILFMYLFMLIVGANGMPGWEGWQGLSARDVLVIFDAQRAVVMDPFWVITLEYFFLYIHCLMYAIIGVVISTIAKSRVASVAAAGGVFFASNILSALLSSYSWYRFIIFNNTNLTAYISSGPSLGDMTMGFSAGIYLAYLALLLGLSYYIFEKRDAV